LLNRIIEAFADLGREFFAIVVGLAAGALFIYLYFTNAEGISAFILNFGK
jgi:hypothetical protein